MFVQRKTTGFYEASKSTPHYHVALVELFGSIIVGVCLAHLFLVAFVR